MLFPRHYSTPNTFVIKIRFISHGSTFLSIALLEYPGKEASILPIHILLQFHGEVGSLFVFSLAIDRAKSAPINVHTEKLNQNT